MTRSTFSRDEADSPVIEIVRKGLLFCGILSSLVYVGTDILAASSWPGYRYADQMISELMAVDAPTRPFMILGFSVFNVLVIAFGSGIRASAGRKRPLGVTGLLLIAYGAVGFAGLLFAPMHRRGTVTSATDVWHIILTVVIVLLSMLSLGFGSTAVGRRFRLYSYATILLSLFTGALAGLQGPRMAAKQQTPGFGIMERVSIYSTLLWVLVLAVALLRRDQGRGDAGVTNTDERSNSRWTR